MDEIGPVDYAIIAFPGSRFTGAIAPALAELVATGTVRIIDAAFVTRDEAGVVAGFEMTELAPEVQAAFDAAGVEVSGLFNEDDLMAAGEELEPGSSALLLVWENIWARRVAGAVREADGELLDFGRIPHDVVQAAREYVLSNLEGGS